MKINRTVFFCSVLIFMLFSCQPEPEQLQIDSEVLVKVLADIHVSEGALLSIRPGQKDSLKNVYYQQVYEIHGVTGDAFEHDLNILKLRPKLMEKIYEKVTAELNQRETEIGKEEPETKK